MKLFYTIFILPSIVFLALTNQAFADDSQDTSSEFWTQGIHCPDISDSVLRLGMKDSKNDKRISDFQLFLADYYDLDKSVIVNGKFDKVTLGYVIRLHKESGLKQKFVDRETRGIVNVRCGDAGIRPTISNFSSSASTIRKGDSATLTFSAANTNYCKILNITEAREQGDEWDGYDGDISLEKNQVGYMSASFRVRPVKTSVYELFCSYEYPADHVVGGSTQSMKHLTVTVR